MTVKYYGSEAKVRPSYFDSRESSQLLLPMKLFCHFDRRPVWQLIFGNFVFTLFDDNTATICFKRVVIVSTLFYKNENIKISFPQSWHYFTTWLTRS